MARNSTAAKAYVQSLQHLRDAVETFVEDGNWSSYDLTRLKMQIEETKRLEKLVVQDIAASVVG